MPGTEKQNKMFKETRGYTQGGNPFPVTSCGRRRNDGSPLTMRKTTKGKGRTFRTSEEGAGMKGPMKDSKGRPTRKAIALKKWGFGSVGAAAKFCRANKKLCTTKNHLKCTVNHL